MMVVVFSRNWWYVRMFGYPQTISSIEKKWYGFAVLHFFPQLRSNVSLIESVIRLAPIKIAEFTVRQNTVCMYWKIIVVFYFQDFFKFSHASLQLDFCIKCHFYGLNFKFVITVRMVHDATHGFIKLSQCMDKWLKLIFQIKMTKQDSQMHMLDVHCCTID